MQFSFWWIDCSKANLQTWLLNHSELCFRCFIFGPPKWYALSFRFGSAGTHTHTHTPEPCVVVCALIRVNPHSSPPSLRRLSCVTLHFLEQKLEPLRSRERWPRAHSPRPRPSSLEPREKDLHSSMSGTEKWTHFQIYSLRHPHQYNVFVVFNIYQQCHIA